jgi:hypothetical protein
VAPGTPTAVEVYSDAEEIELVLNGRSLGRSPAGREHGFKCTFEVKIEPGELVAIAHSNGSEQARTSLRTATGPLLVQAKAEREVITADDRDLAYIPVELRDRDGNLAHAGDRPIHVTVEGPGNLTAVGSGRPDQSGRFDSSTHMTFDGRALVIVRPTGPGKITLSITAEGAEPATVELRADPPGAIEANAALIRAIGEPALSAKEARP